MCTNLSSALPANASGSCLLALRFTRRLVGRLADDGGGEAVEISWLLAPLGHSQSLGQAQALHVGDGLGRPQSRAVAFQPAETDQLDDRPRERPAGADLPGQFGDGPPVR